MTYALNSTASLSAEAFISMRNQLWGQFGIYVGGEQLVVTNSHVADTRVVDSELLMNLVWEAAQYNSNFVTALTAQAPSVSAKQEEVLGMLLSVLKRQSQS